MPIGAGGIRTRASKTFQAIEREVTSSRRRRRLIDERARHAVRFFGGKFPAGDVACFLARDAGMIVVASEKHANLVADELRTLGIDVDDGMASGEIVFVSGEAVASAIIADGSPTLERLEEMVGARVDKVVARCGSATIYGEVVDLLAQQERTNDAIALEKLWNGLLAEKPVRLLCGYGFASIAASDVPAIGVLTR